MTCLYSSPKIENLTSPLSNNLRLLFLIYYSFSPDQCVYFRGLVVRSLSTTSEIIQTDSLELFTVWKSEKKDTQLERIYVSSIHSTLTYKPPTGISSDKRRHLKEIPMLEEMFFYRKGSVGVQTSGRLIDIVLYGLFI